MNRTQAVIQAPNLRKPSKMMRLHRLGSFHQSRLSFMRILLRRLRDERWQFADPVWNIDEAGVGHAVLTVTGPNRSYSLVAFAHDLPDEMRSDRVIATAWDATFALFDGIPTSHDIERLSKNVPHQEAGRVSAKELSLSRANRSSRLWEHVISSLAEGGQPDPNKIAAVGYLMRTTAVYGSGKFGAADREDISERPEFSAPFQVEMLNVYLIRTFVLQLVDHLAKAKGGENAASLAPEIKRSIGIGNSTGLGMAPFLVNHPGLLNAWITTRETAIARVCALPTTNTETLASLRKLAHRIQYDVGQWQTGQEHYQGRISTLHGELTRIIDQLASPILTEPYPFQHLMDWAGDTLSTEGQELLAALLLEPHGEIVDDLADTLSWDESDLARLDGATSIAATLGEIETRYDWALATDHDHKDANARFWYVSEAKLEPRLGERYEEPGCELEQPLGISRQLKSYHADLNAWAIDGKGEKPLGEFLLAKPDHRNIARRVQQSATMPYSEIQDNLLASDMVPVDMLRCKLSFFGATRFDPRSDRWVRICMYQNAPLPDELASSGDDWIYPDIPQNA